MKKERRMVLFTAVILMSAVLLSACGTIDLPCLLGKCPETGTCGNGVVDTGETCDPPSSCPTSCDDGDVCTTDTLTGSAATCTAACTHTAIPGCCTSASQCDDGNVCTTDACVSNVCVHAVRACCCTSASQCDDGNVCTTDACIDNCCAHTPIPNCCLSNSQCDDGNCATIDTCEGNVCMHTVWGGACLNSLSCYDGNPCTTDVCDDCACYHTPIQGCCISASQCDDGNVCTMDACTNNVCVHAAITPCCGNGVVETGEDCDPPAADYCGNDCRFACYSFLEGTWITRLTTTGTITAPAPVGTLTGATIDVLQRMVIKDDCRNSVIVGQLEICALSTTANSTIPLKIDYSSAVLASMTATGSMPFSMYKVGDAVMLPSFTIMTGWTGEPNCSPIPVLPDPYCLCFVDSDHDGICGITLPMHLFNGALSFNAYAGLTMNVSVANMVLTDSNTTTGTTAFPINGWILGSTAGATGTLNIVPSSDAVPITMIRLNGDVPCSEVLTHCTGAECVP